MEIIDLALNQVLYDLLKLFNNVRGRIFVTHALAHCYFVKDRQQT